MEVDKLFSSLLTFEMSLNGKLEKKNKEIVLQSSVEKEHDDLDKEYEESLADSISILCSQYSSTKCSKGLKRDQVTTIRKTTSLLVHSPPKNSGLKI